MARRKLIASGGRSKQSYGRCSGTPDVPHEEPQPHMINMLYNVGFNQGRAGGQTIGHLHIHVTPAVPATRRTPRAASGT